MWVRSQGLKVGAAACMVPAIMAADGHFRAGAARTGKKKNIKQKGSQRGFVTHTVYSAKSTGWHGQRLLKEQLTQK